MKNLISKVEVCNFLPLNVAFRKTEKKLKTKSTEKKAFLQYKFSYNAHAYASVNFFYVQF